MKSGLRGERRAETLGQKPASFRFRIEQQAHSRCRERREARNSMNDDDMNFGRCICHRDIPPSS